MKSKAYLFDFDGTLVDSMPTYVSIMLHILDEEGVAYAPDIVKIITPLGYSGTAEYYRKIGVRTPAEELTARMRSRAYDAYANRIGAKEGVIETLAELKRQGAHLSVLTASPHDMLDPCLKRLGIFDAFENVWSCDDFSTTKSDPRIYSLAAERMGFDVSEVVFVDDNVNAVSTAGLAGMIAYGIYDASSDELIDEMRSVSDRYLMSFDELLSDR
ncbi:MAG: HAD family phosphatase [Clostridia bacterium]|nr:HAD family phosphatase [Clostridia bacterium]